MALALVIGTGLGATNAMFLQTVRHPAPLFMDTASIVRPADPTDAGPAIVERQPIPVPLMRPVELTVTPKSAPAVQRPVSVSIPDNVGNRDVAELQARLTELGFFAGKIDGYYGPKTAEAIRRFETTAGLTPVGAVSPDVLAAAKAYVPMITPQPQTQPKPAAPAVAQNVATAPAVSPENDPIGRIAAGVADDTARVAAIAPAQSAVADPAPAKPAALDPELVRMVQTGLSRLGFLHGEISGRFDGETARAIREFENYNNFRVTGELTPDLVDVLMANGAFN